MNVGNSVRRAIDEWTQDELESAMLHACNAIDGTAKKEYSDLGNKDRFTKILRENYKILKVMGVPGINVERTRFPVRFSKPTTTDGMPDIADIIYGIRCYHGHGDELPDGFELIPDASRSSENTTINIKKGMIRLSDRIIFALLAIAVLSPYNKDQKVPDGYLLTLPGRVFVINDWWGWRNHFLEIIEKITLPSVVMDFGDWMDDL